MCKINCQNCGKETTNKKFCSRSCAATSNNTLYPKRILKRKCSRCNNTIRNYKSSLCEQHYNENLSNKKDAILNTTLEEYTSKGCIKKLHTSSKFAHIRGLARSWFKHLTKLPCANCGYNKHVELCHIKPISSFPSIATLAEVNNKNNLIQLCPNCHWEFDNKKLHLDFPEQLKSQ